MNALKLREKRDHLRNEIKRLFDLAKVDGGFDFAKVDLPGVSGETDRDKSKAVIERIKQMNAELEDIQKDFELINGAEELAKKFAQPANEIIHPEPTDSRMQRKSWGVQITSHPVFKRWREGDRSGQIELKDAGLMELKADFGSSLPHGWPPESTRIPGFVEMAVRPIQVLDIIPAAQTGQASIVYMEETTRTHAAAEVAEGVAVPESTFDLTEKNSPVREIGDSVPVTDIQLEDVPFVQSYLDGRLRFGVRQRLDKQVINGDGVGSNLTGILNTTGILTQARGTDPQTDAVHKAITLIRANAFTEPTHVLFHPTDWQKIRLLRDANGNYLWGPPSEPGPARIWGLPVVISQSLPVGTALVGSFLSPWVMLFERRGVTVSRGTVGTQFTEGKQTIKATMRVGFVVFRPSAFATVTGL